MKIVALLTCHNRRIKTIKCLETLTRYSQNIDIHIVLDGCTDDTKFHISNKFPKVKITESDGDLFWSRGMYTAWKNSLSGDYDFYIWINDDIELFPFYLDELLMCYNLIGNDCIISGLIKDKESNQIIYGGSNSKKELLDENKTPQGIKYMNGNAVLIPKSVYEKIGIIDPKFHHDLGDVEYGLRAIKNNIPIFSTTKAIAYGYKNDICRIRKYNSSFIERFRYLYSPLGNPPKLNFYFRYKYKGIINAVMYYIFIHIINLLPDRYIDIIFKNKYK